MFQKNKNYWIVLANFIGFGEQSGFLFWESKAIVILPILYLLNLLVLCTDKKLFPRFKSFLSFADINTILETFFEHLHKQNFKLFWSSFLSPFVLWSVDAFFCWRHRWINGLWWQKRVEPRNSNKMKKNPFFVEL